MRKKKKIPLGVDQHAEKNKLAKALEAGENIVGMTGYYPIDDSANEYEDLPVPSVFVKVKVVGLSTGKEEESCGVSIIVEPVSGAGKFKITPCQWLDTPTDIAEYLVQESRKAKAKETYCKILISDYLRTNKNDLIAFVNTQLTEEQYKEFWNQIEEMKGGADLKGVTAADVKWLAQVVANKVHGVEEKASRDRY